MITLLNKEISDLIYKLKNELNYIEEDLTYCGYKLPYCNVLEFGNMRVKLTIQEVLKK